MIRTGQLLKSLILLTAIFSGWGLTSPCQATDLSGCWSGSWGSYKCRHHGPLQAQFVRCDENSYQVHFSGRFFKVIPFRYSVVLNVVEDGDTVKLTGDSYLGRMMGTFTYEATATATTFHSDYFSKKDWGYFELSR